MLSFLCLIILMPERSFAQISIGGGSSGVPDTKIGESVGKETLNIAGVHLGMSKEEAVAAITEKLGIAESDLKMGRVTNPKFGANPATGKPYVENMSYQIGKSQSATHYRVDFLPNVTTPEKSNSVVSRISYSVPFTRENMNGLYQATVNKFGKPSYESYGETKWCSLETKKMTGFNSTFTQCIPNTAYMEISNVSLLLTSKEFDIALNEYKAKAAKSDFNF